MTPTRQPMRLRLTWWLAAILVIGLAVRLPYLTTRSIWFDEASSWQTANFRLAEIPESLRFSVHMPLYYLFLKAWIAIAGNSLLSLRGFSVLCGLITIGGMYLFGRALYGLTAASVAEQNSDRSAERFGLLVAALTALNAFQVSTSIEVRMYSLGTAWMAWAGWLLLRCLHQGGLVSFNEENPLPAESHTKSWTAWVWYGVATTGFLYTHHFAMLTVASQCVFLAGLVIFTWKSGKRTEARRGGVSAALTLACVGLAYLPGLSLLLHQFSRVRREYWIGPMQFWTVPYTLFHFVLPLDHKFDGRIGGAVVIVTLLCLLLGSLHVKARTGEWFLVSNMVLPLVAVAAVSWWTPIWESRYFRFAQLSWLVATVLFVERMFARRRVWRALVHGAVLAVSLATTVLFWVVREIPDRPGMRGAIHEIAQKKGDDELIIASDNLLYFPAKYHASREARLGIDSLRLLPPYPTMTWGWHLIRKNDLLSPDELRKGGLDGVWIVGSPPVSIRTLLNELHFSLKDTNRFEYDYGSPQWTVVVNYYRRNNRTGLVNNDVGGFPQ